MDIITTLREEHDRVLKLIRQCESSDSDEVTRQVVVQLLQDGSVHEAAEEAGVWSTLKDKAPTALSEALKEENELKQFLKQLKDELGDPELRSRVMRLKELLLHHISTEQDQLFPWMATHLDQETREQLAQAYQSAKVSIVERMARLNVTMAPEVPAEQLRRS